ncbi:MAG: alpha/beta fold hydrolase [Opitutales bacterium]|nr:alpha/beta fold hydrolase [Opitutales bacterium]NRA27897.1 alpha/beta hydrolase [Opitutales bacterium]
MWKRSNLPGNPVGTIVCVHGIFDTRWVFKRMADRLADLGYDIFAPTMNGAGGVASMQELAEQIDSLLKAEAIGVESKPFYIIGFSMGGIVSRTLLQCVNPALKPRALITLGTPHHGSALCMLFWGKGTRDMRPGSRHLRKLKESEATLDGTPCYSFWTPFDLMIIPARSSKWPRAENHTFRVPLHPWLLTDKTVFAAIQKVLETGTDLT